MGNVSVMFTSNVQPKKRMKAEPAAWHCNCRRPLGRYKLNHARLMRCPSCGVARHSDPTARANTKLAPQPPTSLGADATSQTR
jgi:hypothetical protein